MAVTDLRVDRDRLWADLSALSEIGRGQRGISRLAFTPPDMEARRWLLRRMQEAGMKAWMDPVGSVFGRLDAQAEGTQEDAPAVAAGESSPAGRLGRSERAAILVGSHIDTVPEGGMFDGALGVLSALECARAIRQGGLVLRHPLEVVAFANEEGSRIGPAIFGSRAFTGAVGAEEWSRVRPAIKDAGLAGGTSNEPPAPAFRHDAYSCYLELHIEQGGVLDAAGEDIGVVQGIVCISAFTATFRGVANHAGTTPMDQRKDALLGACEFVLAVPPAVATLGSGSSVGTCGQIKALPGGRNVIPGEILVSVETRDLDEAVAARIAAGLKERAREIAARRGLEVILAESSFTPAAMMDGRIQDAVETAARGLGLKTRRMPSGAGHDAMVMAKHVPCGMIFVPSRGGVSHSPDEVTSREECVAGANVLLKTILALDFAM